MLESIWVSARLCPDLHLQDIANIPLNDIIQDVYGIPLVKAVESFEPKLADDYMVRMLQMKNSRLLLQVEHTTYSQYEKPVLFARLYYRGDRCRFTIELSSR
jgi:DNA-binding GntR family transcriptional regulator